MVTSSFSQPGMRGSLSGQPQKFEEKIPWNGTQHTAGEDFKFANKMEGLKHFFGINQKPDYTAPSYFKHKRENFDLPDSYIGQNELLAYILVSECTASMSWPIFKLLPW